MRTHQSPLLVFLNAFHKEIRSPESIEEITSSDFFLPMVLTKVEPLENICVPGFKVDGECTWSLVAALVHVACSVVEDPEHRDKTIRGTVSACNIGTCSTDAVHVQTDTPSILRDHGTGLECVVDTIDAVIFHVDQEA